MPSREKEYQGLYKSAIRAFINKDYKQSYCSFKSVAYAYKMDRTVLANDAKYFLAIHFLNGFGIEKNLAEAYTLFGDVSKKNTINEKFDKFAKYQISLDVWTNNENTIIDFLKEKFYIYYINMRYNNQDSLEFVRFMNTKFRDITFIDDYYEIEASQRINRINIDSLDEQIESYDRANVTGFIDPLIGTIKDGHVFPGLCLPFGIVKVGFDVEGLNFNAGLIAKDAGEIR
ncbi:15914_t:CDS:2 [Gigaspora margarita]|uniref:15914_t:CDS:1 n=1 Tax=Gigaspora margarita TaxID=4874 RepID=A0ABM8VZS7_GIGMA|nr:15914_t:CDS:2 [Gigaspora margarita]